MKPLLTLLCFAGVIAVLLFAPVLYTKWYEPMFEKPATGAFICFVYATLFVLVLLGYGIYELTKEK